MLGGSEGGAAVIIMGNHTDYFCDFCKIIIINLLDYCYYQQQIVYSYYEKYRIIEYSCHYICDHKDILL